MCVLRVSHVCASKHHSYVIHTCKVVTVEPTCWMLMYMCNATFDGNMNIVTYIVAVFVVLCTVQITHNLNSPRVSHACPMRVTRSLHACHMHVTRTQQTQKHAWKGNTRVHACKMLHTSVTFYTRV